jgi:DNA-binding transcriptional ArsR family regulator
MPLAAPISAEAAGLIAQRLRVLADPVRIRLLDELRHGEQTVTELADRVGVTQQNCSKHLALVHRAGLVARRREGRVAYYSLVDPSALWVCSRVHEALHTQAEDLEVLLADERDRSAA